MESRPVLVLVGRQRSHNVLLMAYSLAVGLAFLLGVPRPPSVVDTLNQSFVTLWMLGLVASGALGLVGAFWRGAIQRGLGLERAAMLINTGSVVGYAISVATAGSAAIFAAGFCIAWGIANLVRAAQISQDLRNLGKGERDAGGHGQCRGAGDRRSRWWRPGRSDSSNSEPPKGEGRLYFHPQRFDSEVGRGPSKGV